MSRAVVYPVSHVGSGRTVQGHQRRSPVSEGADAGWNDRQLALYGDEGLREAIDQVLDEDPDQGVEEPEISGEPCGKELHMDVRSFVESDEADPAGLDEEGVQHVPWPVNVDRKPEQMLRLLVPTDPPVLLDVAVPRGSAQLHVAVRRLKGAD